MFTKILKLIAGLLKFPDGESVSFASSERTELIRDFLKQNLTVSMSVSDECAYANNFDQDEEAEHFPETGRLFYLIPHMNVTY